MNFVGAIVRWPKRLLVLLLIAGSVALVQAEDWPQFRGPTGQGHATERGLPLEWSESKNIIWKAPVAGLGWSSPAVANGRLYIRGQNHLFCFGKK